jgi:hypothetical protein
MLYLHEQTLSLAGPHCNCYTVTFTLHSSCHTNTHTHTHIRTSPKQMRHLSTRIDRKSQTRLNLKQSTWEKDEVGTSFDTPFFCIFLKLSYDTTRVEDAQLYDITSDSAPLSLQLFIVYNSLCYVQFRIKSLASHCCVLLHNVPLSFTVCYIW